MPSWLGQNWYLIIISSRSQFHVIRGRKEDQVFTWHWLVTSVPSSFSISNIRPTCWLLLHLQTAGCKQRLSPHCKTQLGSAPSLRSAHQQLGGWRWAECSQLSQPHQPLTQAKLVEQTRGKMENLELSLPFIIHLHHQTETCSKLEGESKESHREKKNVNMVIFYGTFIILYQAAVTQ